MNRLKETGLVKGTKSKYLLVTKKSTNYIADSLGSYCRKCFSRNYLGGLFLRGKLKIFLSKKDSHHSRGEGVFCFFENFLQNFQKNKTT
jgi:hypothetical protein